jgi:SP family sugar:H+ symporter-like MFS transporter
MGALIAGPVADRIGRKWSISAWCIILHIGLIVQISAPEPKWYQSRLKHPERLRTKLTFLVVVVGRWIAGLGVGALSLLVPSMPIPLAPISLSGQI